MLRYFTKTAALLSLILFPILAFAVTDKEMDQARAIAAKAYIRYVNNGSGYLDEINPTSVADLEKALKPKEKENIKAFLAIPVPSDYKNWDKQKLVEYWAVTAFQNKGLDEKGRGGRIRARSQINKMTIAAPSAQPAAPAKQDQDKNKPAATAASPSAANPQKTQSADSLSAGSPEITDQLKAAEEALLDQLGDEDDVVVSKADNYTWVYIMVLAILVAIVIALVVYAANVMKRNDSDASRRKHDADAVDSSESLERLEAAVADKDLEISMLSKKLESANRQNSELKTKIESLVAEIASLRANHPSVAGSNENRETPQRHQPMRSIYLGRANAKGIFVRADRTLNVGHSVFVLDTTDGFSGTFRVADSPAAWSLALSNPAEYLSTACTVQNPDDREGVSKIVTESSGTAIFEGGCWRVTRKARIRYE